MDHIGASHGHETSSVVRPYRSRKIPPCNRCRQRKARCTIDLPGSACLLCRLHAVDCQRSTHVRSIERTTDRYRQPRQHRPAHSSIDVANNGACVPNRSDRSEGRRNSRSPSVSAHIMGPIAGQDAHVLGNFLTHTGSNVSTTRSRPNPYNVYSNNPNNPVLYINVPRRRAGLPGLNRRGFRPFETLSKLVEPNLSELVKLYYENFHLCFPIVEDQTFEQTALFLDLVDSDALKSEIIASAFIFWNQSPILKSLHRPDIRYAWNLAVESLHEEFLAPNMSTLIAAVIDLTGRPIYSITGNATNLGRTISLAHTLGLNRNPSAWQIPNLEKHHRIVLWWAILIHDRWASLSHGTPPQISKDNYDVPRPTMQMLVRNRSMLATHMTGAHFFIELCALTEKLGELLPLIYDLHSSKLRNDIKNLKRLEAGLEEWAALLPSDFITNSNGTETIPGAKSLLLGYYTIRISICRLALYTQRLDIGYPTTETLQLKCRESVQTILDFVQSLSDNDLGSFWLPYTAYSFTAAVTVTLRCSLESTEADIASHCIANAKSLLDHLRHLKDQKNWDLADICLAQCEVIVQKMSATEEISLLNRNNAVISAGGQDGSHFYSEQNAYVHRNSEFTDRDLWTSDLSNLFPDLWDMFQIDGTGPL